MAMVVAAALFAAAFLVLERMAPTNREASVPHRLGSGPPGKTNPSPPAVLPGEKGEKRKIAIIIDDIGYDNRIIPALAELPAPIAFAVLPFTPHAASAANGLHAAGKEILLHLPMEPHSYPADNPGKGALFTNMTAETIQRQLAAALAGVPHASGVTNHMGSRFMEDQAGMAIVMESLAGRGLFFVDSLTTPTSRGQEAAAKAGVRFAARSAFIDHLPHVGAVFERLTHLPQGEESGTAPLLLIGHPRTETIRALRAALPIWEEQGIGVISVAAFLAETAGGNPLRPGRKP
jgi:hypothetical protein